MLFGLLFVLVMAGSLWMIHAQSDHLAMPPQTMSAQNFVGAFRAEAHAALSYATQNQSATGVIPQASLGPYLDGWNPPANAMAQIVNGDLVVSAPPPTGLGAPVWLARNIKTMTDNAAYGLATNGQMMSEDGLTLGAAPGGVANGEAVYATVRPVSGTIPAISPQYHNAPVNPWLALDGKYVPYTTVSAGNFGWCPPYTVQNSNYQLQQYCQAGPLRGQFPINYTCSCGSVYESMQGQVAGGAPSISGQITQNVRTVRCVAGRGHGGHVGGNPNYFCATASSGSSTIASGSGSTSATMNGSAFGRSFNLSLSATLSGITAWGSIPTTFVPWQ